jgi:Cu-processing system permease protein
MKPVLTVARLEFVSAARLNWIRLLTAAFALLSAAAAYAAGAAGELSGADGFARTTMTLVPVVLILVPLAAIVLGISGQVAEPGSEPFLFGQPVERATVVLGRWAGQSAALTASIACGFGLGSMPIMVGAGLDGALRFGFFVASSAVLAVMFLAIAAAIASGTEKRAAALGVGTFAWFFFVLLYDAAALALAGWISGSKGGHLLFASIFGNPADLIRIAVLSISGTPNILGAAGDAWLRFIGGAVSATLAFTAAVAVWTAAPLATAVYLIRRRDL